MITEGNAGTYVSGTTGRPLARPTKRRRGHIAIQPRCKTCRLPLSGRGDHICRDLSAPEPVIVRVEKPKKVKKAAPTPRPRKPKAVNTCADCKTVITSVSVRCAKCANLARRAISPERDKEIAALYLELRSAKRVATHFGVSQFAVADSLDRSGIQRPGMGGGSGWRTLSEAVVDEIVAEYQGGASVPSISARRGMSEKTVYKALHHRDAVKRDGRKSDRGAA